jgi:hypothetical protein
MASESVLFCTSGLWTAQPLRDFFWLLCGQDESSQGSPALRRWVLEENLIFSLLQACCLGRRSQIWQVRRVIVLLSTCSSYRGSGLLCRLAMWFGHTSQAFCLLLWCCQLFSPIFRVPLPLFMPSSVCSVSLCRQKAAKGLEEEEEVRLCGHLPMWELESLLTWKRVRGSQFGTGASDLHGDRVTRGQWRCKILDIRLERALPYKSGLTLPFLWRRVIWGSERQCNLAWVTQLVEEPWTQEN